VNVAACCWAGGDEADIADKQVRYDAAVASRDSITAVLDYRKQPSFEVGTMGFWMVTGQHPCGADYPMRLPARYDTTAYPAMRSSYPAAYVQLMTECVAFDPRDRPDIGVVAARLREMRRAAWMSAGEVLAVSRRLVRTVCVDAAASAADWLAVVCMWYCGGQTDREGVVAERDATVAQLAARLVHAVCVDTAACTAC
jgi:hypothetical protein